MQLSPHNKPVNSANPSQGMFPPKQSEPLDSDDTTVWVSSPEQHSPPEHIKSNAPCRSLDPIPAVPPSASTSPAAFPNNTAVRLASNSQHLHPKSIPIRKKRLTDSQRVKTISDALSTILDCLDDDPSREGLRKTPVRFAKAILSLTEGYRKSPKEVLGDAEFHENHSEMVIVRNIDVFSLCEHHLLPFHGICHVSYIPSGSIIGLSKVARIIDVFAKRFQVQERLTTQIADAIQSSTKAAGVFVYISCSHMCMAMRGVQKVGTQTSTTAARGRYAQEPQLRSEALNIFLGSQNQRFS